MKLYRRRLAEYVARHIAYVLPRSVLYWVLIRVWAMLTTKPPFTHLSPEDVTVFDALKRLEPRW